MYESSVLLNVAPAGRTIVSTESPDIFNVWPLIVTKSSSSNVMVCFSLSVKSYPSKFLKAVLHIVKSFCEFALKSQIIQSKSVVSEPPSIDVVIVEGSNVT